MHKIGAQRFLILGKHLLLGSTVYVAPQLESPFRESMAAQVGPIMNRAFAPLTMSTVSRPVFVYGTFLWIQKPRTQAFFGTADEPDIALEILREFSASEFVGKLYTKPVIGKWTIAEFEQIRQTAWYEVSEKAPQFIVFDMRGSGPWEVLHFRIESDESETGPYVAVALRQFEKGKAPLWVKSLRSSLGDSESPGE